MGTTLVAALVTPEKALCGQRRRQPVLRDRERRASTRVTRDHSLVEDLVERGEITPEEARNHPRKNLITRAVGVGSQPSGPTCSSVESQGGYAAAVLRRPVSNTVTDEEIRYEEVVAARYGRLLSAAAAAWRWTGARRTT